MVDHPEGWDTRYEWKAVLVLGVGFCLVGLDRWVIAPLLPAIAADLHLNYQQMGNAIGVLSLTWGLFSILMGRLSDSVGRRVILIPALIGFSLLSGLSGAATGIISLLGIRALMGIADGAYLATSVAATAEASSEKRRGLNLGFQLSGFTLFGLGLGPIIATQLLTVVPSWRWVFFIVGIPGLIVAWFMYRILRDPVHIKRKSAQPAEPVRWSELLRNRNIVLCMLGLVCAMSCMFVLGAMVPSYLQTYQHLSTIQMGEVMSGLGFGGFLGAIFIPAVSDYIGRRPAALLGFAGSGLLLYAFTSQGPDVVPLFITLFGTAFFTSGLLTLLTGPLATESVSPVLLSSAAGLVSGTGEIFGGGIGPIIAGFVADNHGIQNVFAVSFVGLALGLLLSPFFVETAPRKLAANVRRQAAKSEGAA